MKSVVFLLLTLVVGSAKAETDPEITPTPPVDPKVILQISVAKKSNQFRIGETIPITLAFSSRVKNRYQLEEASYDRSGRLDCDHFTVTPADGAEDPLAEYFAPGTVHIGGGMRNSSVLAKKPWAIQQNLNEWIRFTKPGEYKLTVSSDRVELLNSSHVHGRSPVTAISNTITLKIVPADPEWQRRVLNDAVAKLNAPEPMKRASQGAFEPSRLEAGETLRFLGTADAVRELVRQLGAENSGIQSTCFFGIIASPEKTVAREALAEALVAPDFPITDDFLNALEWMEGRKTAADPESKKSEQETLAKLVEAFPKKRDAAARVTLYTIVNDVWVRGNPRLLPAETKRALIKQLVSQFDQLPLEQQASLLDWRWNDLKDPALLPSLKQLVQIDVKKIPPEKLGWGDELPGLALRRWYELDPASARPAVIQEITQLRPRFTARDLDFLPDESLPEVDQALADHYAAAEIHSVASTNLGTFIARYATRTILSQVVKKFDQQIPDDSCGIQEHILAYILRVDPAAALPRIEKALANRRKQGHDCMDGILISIARIHYDPVLEELAVRLLEDSDLGLAEDAAGLLGGFGSPAAEAVLWRRYETWSKRWVGRERELNFSFATVDRDDPRFLELGFGKSLFYALATGDAWLTDETKLRRLKSVNKILPIESVADRYLEQWRRPAIGIDISGHPFRATVAQYNFSSMSKLKEKLAQFPRGTKFSVSSILTEPETILDLRAFLESHGMSLEEEKI
jgi:hypothetical protein